MRIAETHYKLHSKACVPIRSNATLPQHAPKRTLLPYVPLRSCMTVAPSCTLVEMAAPCDHRAPWHFGPVGSPSGFVYKGISLLCSTAVQTTTTHLLLCPTRMFFWPPLMSFLATPESLFPNDFEGFPITVVSLCVFWPCAFAKTLIPLRWTTF